MATNDAPNNESEIGDRRPLASRNTGWAHKATAMLAKTRIQPNHISIGSMVFAALAGALFYTAGQLSGMAAAVVLIFAAIACQFRLLCNLFDGMLAVEAGRRSADGLAWNEFPDRYADILIFVGIGYGFGFASLGWAAGCFAVLTAYTRELGNAVGVGADFSGPMAKQHRMAAITIASVLAAIAAVFTSSGENSIPAMIMGAALLVIVLGALLTSVLRTRRMLAALSGTSKPKPPQPDDKEHT